MREAPPVGQQLIKPPHLTVEKRRRENLSNTRCYTQILLGIQTELVCPNFQSSNLPMRGSRLHPVSDGASLKRAVPGVVISTVTKDTMAYLLSLVNTEIV